MLNFVEKAQAFGFSHAAVLSVATLVVRPEVRQMCAADKCQMYARSWSCPPGCGTLEELEEKIKSCDGGILVQTTGLLEDDFDYEGMQHFGELHKDRMRAFYPVLSALVPGTKALGSGACTLCEACTYPDSPCRRPEDAMVSMEAYGLWVSDVCEQNNLPYNHGPGSITYTGCYLFPKQV